MGILVQVDVEAEGRSESADVFLVADPQKGFLTLKSLTEAVLNLLQPFTCLVPDL